MTLNAAITHAVSETSFTRVSLRMTEVTTRMISQATASFAATTSM